MKSKHWRALAEVIGVISIVVGLLLVAWEIRQANKIARAEVVMNLAEQYNQFNSARFESPEVAELSNMLLNPDQFEISDVDRSRMAGAAWHFGNILWSAQAAYDNGLLDLVDLANYRSHLSWMLEYMPGLASEFVFMWNTTAGMQGVYVFEPLEQYVAAIPESE
jgi:hypothetical protein